MPNGTYGGVRGRKTKVGRKLSFSSYSIKAYFLKLRAIYNSNTVELPSMVTVRFVSVRDADMLGAVEVETGTITLTK